MSLIIFWLFLLRQTYSQYPLCLPPCSSCSSLDSPACSSCIPGYYLKEYNCIQCKVENCKYCNPQCKQCQDGYFKQLAMNTGSTNNDVDDNDDDDGGDEDIALCIQCYWPCSSCTNLTYCTACSLGYQLSDGKCINCKANQYPSNGQCHQCNASCTTCVSSQGCISCMVGLYLQGKQCIPCQIGCKICPNASYCSQCSAYYYLMDGHCHRCIRNCMHCNDNASCIECGGYHRIQSQCSDCYPGFYQSQSGVQIDEVESQCLSCPWECSQCKSGRECTGCRYDSHRLINSTCINCNVVKCWECPQECLQCNQLNQCIKCNDNHYKKEGKCHACPTNCGQEICNQVDQPYQCQVCSSNKCSIGYIERTSLMVVIIILLLTLAVSVAFILKYRYFGRRVVVYEEMTNEDCQMENKSYISKNQSQEGDRHAHEVNEQHHNAQSQHTSNDLPQTEYDTQSTQKIKLEERSNNQN